MKPSKHTIASLALASLVFTSGQALAQEFAVFEGKNVIQEGEGGTKTIVDGIEFWADGAPPRKFKLLGYITDRRHKSGLFGAISMSKLESSVAKAAKENGGDAVILMSANAETVGTVSQGSTIGQTTTTNSGSSASSRGTAWGTGTTAAVQKQNSKYAVVKYVQVESKAESTSPSQAQPETPPASQDSTPK